MQNRITNAKQTEQYLQNLLEDVVTDVITLPEEKPEQHIEITAQFHLGEDDVEDILTYLDNEIAKGKPVTVYVFN